MAASIKDRVTVVEGDITKQRVDAIVNAANNTLLGGGGVDGAIHYAAGRELLEECRKIGGCPTGEARITRGYNLPAQWVIHTVGPIWRTGQDNEDDLLASCYRNSYVLAKEYNAQSIAFPSISTGAYGFPIARASRIAVTQTRNFLLRNDTPAEVIFVCHSRHDYDVYVKAVADFL